MAAVLTYAIGDIHGSYTKLANLLRHCLDHCGGNTARLVLLGDYIDRGKRSREVVSLPQLVSFATLESMQSYVDRVLADQSLRHLQSGAVRVVAARGFRRASYRRAGEQGSLGQPGSVAQFAPRPRPSGERRACPGDRGTPGERCYE